MSNSLETGAKPEHVAPLAKPANDQAQQRPGTRALWGAVTTHAPPSDAAPGSAAFPSRPPSPHRSRQRRGREPERGSIVGCMKSPERTRTLWHGCRELPSRSASRKLKQVGVGRIAGHVQGDPLGEGADREVGVGAEGGGDDGAVGDVEPGVDGGFARG